jgi:hypothetical protein
MMTVAAARALGTTSASSASACRRRRANLARLTHAPRLTLVYESGSTFSTSELE